jgi:CubicO group peptidase (beta-lactamase class C family)
MIGRMRRGWLLLLLLAVALPARGFAQALPRAEPETVGMSAERLARLGPVLRGYVEQGQLAGGVVLVARAGRLVHQEAFGMRDREAGAAMTEDAIFRIASQTKALVSVAAMMLVEEGRLGLADPVGRYIPEFERTTVAEPRDGGGYDVVAARRPITIRHLLTHTAGLDYGMGAARDRWQAAGIQGWYLADRDEPVGATVARLAALPFAAHPGERWVYGYATDVLGAVVERVSGERLDRFIESRILGPLGMRDTHFFLPAAKRDRLAAVYSALPGGVVQRAPDDGAAGQGAYVDGPRRNFSGGAGLLSTAGDYARFLQMLLNGGELDGVRLLSPKTVELMTADHAGDLYAAAGQGFGLGFAVLRDPGARGSHGSAGEYGWGGAYHSSYWVDPAERLVVVYLTQLIPAGPIDDFGRVRALVYQAIVAR